MNFKLYICFINYIIRNNKINKYKKIYNEDVIKNAIFLLN